MAQHRTRCHAIYTKLQARLVGHCFIVHLEEEGFGVVGRQGVVYILRLVPQDPFV